MKKYIKIFLGISMCLTILLNSTMVVSASSLDYTNSFSLGEEGSISIDGDFSDWDNLPCSYEYNWDNSYNCWYWGVWIDEEGTFYRTEINTYDTNVRHKMQLHCDGEYVYLHIVYGRNYLAKLNGEDFQFYVGGEMAAFQVVTPEGELLVTMADEAPGVYPLEVRHRDTGLSFTEADGTYAYLLRTEDNVNNELELRIPLEELQRQNPGINVDTLGFIEFFTPNLMYRSIYASGTTTGPLILAALCGGIVICALIGYRRKKHGNL